MIPCVCIMCVQLVARANDKCRSLWLAGWEVDGALPALQTLDMSFNKGLNGSLPAFGATTAAPLLQWLALGSCNYTGMPACEVANALIHDSCRSLLYPSICCQPASVLVCTVTLPSTRQRLPRIATHAAVPRVPSFVLR